jgi:hypothetical protein
MNQKLIDKEPGVEQLKCCGNCRHYREHECYCFHNWEPHRKCDGEGKHKWEFPQRLDMPNEIIAVDLMIDAEVIRTVRCLSPRWLLINRVRKGFSFIDLKKLTGISTAFLCDVENGKKRMRNPALIKKLQRALR